MTAFHHIPVLVDEVLEWLAPEPDGTVVDCTIGGGGHSFALAQVLGSAGHIIGIDQDPRALEAAAEKLRGVAPRVTLCHANFRTLGAVLGPLAPIPNRPFVHVVLADIGVSSHQFDTADRGFSFQHDGPLDMRMSGVGPTARDLIASTSLDDLAQLLKEGGDVRRAHRVAQAMKAEVERDGLQTTHALKALCESALGRPRPGQIHPATTVFQALRIAVNDELGALDALLDSVLRWVCPGGRVGIISFHSGEDRRVKRAFRRFEGQGVIPAGLPITADQVPSHGRVLTRKPVTASERELTENPRARSARLRVFDVEG